MKVNRLRTGVIFILLGLLFLLNTTGALSVDVWHSIFTLWPLLLIAIGIEKIFVSTEHLKPLAYLSPLIIVGTVLYAVFATPNDSLFATDNWERQSQQWSVSQESGIDMVALDVGFGGGRLIMRGGADDDKLLEGQFDYHGDRPDLYSNLRDQTMEIGLQRGNPNTHFSFNRRDRERWIVKLNDDTPTKIDLNAGAAQVRLDLEDIICRKLDLSTGAADIDVTLGAKSPEIDCSVDCGAASIDMVIPQGAGLRIDKSTALSSLSTGDLDLIKTDDWLISPDFDTRDVRITLTIDAGLSSLRIRESHRSISGAASL